MVHAEQRWHRCWLMALATLVSLAGCATEGVGRRAGTFHDLPPQPNMAREASSPRQTEGSPTATRRSSRGAGVFGRLGQKQDDFQLLQESAGLEEDARHKEEQELETADAQALWRVLAQTPTSLKNFSSRRAMVFLLRQVLIDGKDLSYSEVLQRTSRFRSLVVMRPDGYLVSALDGRPLQRMGRMELREGRLMAGSFEVGAFYRDKGGVFYAVDEKLQPLVASSLGELGLEHDWFNAALDGTEDALAEMVMGMGALITHPIRSAEGLAQLPSAVGALIASSPGYFARYSALPIQEQIREAARLSTHLLMLYGSTAGSATRLGSVGARLPVLSLSAEGAMALEQVTIPTGTAAAALGTGASAVYVLMAAERAPKDGSKPSSTEGPGEWKRKKFSGSEEAKRYQEQISGRPADEVFYIDGVEYDGFTSGVLREAKGEHYLNFFKKNGQPEQWYRDSGNFQGLLDQAARQARAARGIPVEWHVAEREMVEILQYHFRQEGISGIRVIFTPLLPP
ncbi:Tox-REase-5 domain-containing protein [Hyalangium versicolor]|uniref:Tox-REase-5 domain-containing protein n=1 Tax=Hyalangium versicolor TaxID=2861190 RepID=UPI001CCE5B0E|nr:Tox-REase-5 domain-containing protein [Hyalangium versicolor]